MKKEYLPWYKKKWNKDNICGITQARLRPGKNSNGCPYVIALPECKHRFYRSAIFNFCLHSFPKQTIPCPICRHPFIVYNIMNFNFDK